MPDFENYGIHEFRVLRGIFWGLLIGCKRNHPYLFGKDGKEKNEWGKYRFNIYKVGNLRAF